MREELRDKLRGEIMAARWSELVPQFARGALLLVRADSDLLEVAVALASDQRTEVEQLLGEGKLWRASDDNARAFTDQNPRFQFVIVQPWVLAQVLPEVAQDTPYRS